MTQTRGAPPVVQARVQRSERTGYRPDIEGLRTVAVVSVVLFHADVPGVGGGYIGVDVFFVISGFLITGLLWREANTAGTVRLRNFYGARARRLLPASALVGVVIAVASAFLLPPLQARSVFGDGIASALYVGNYWFLVHGVDYLAPITPPSPYEHYWSLGVEEQFYFVWPVLILVTAWLIRRVRRRTRTEATSSPRPYLVVLTVVAVVSFALSLAVTYVVPPIAFFSLPTRAWQLAVGGLVALTATQWRRLPTSAPAIIGWSGLAIILLGCTLLKPTTLYPGTAALIPTLGTALVIAAGCASPTRGCGRLLTLAPMQAVGRVSYSWYLWCWPLLLFTPLLVGHPLGLAGRLAVALGALGLAVLTMRLVENPVRFAGPVRRSALRSLAIGGAVTAVTVGMCVALLAVVAVPVGRGAPVAPLAITAAPASIGHGVDVDDVAVAQAFEQVQTAVAAATEPRAVPSNLSPPLADAAAELRRLATDGCMRDGTVGVQPECASGDTASATTVALVGDSHATMWSPAFRRVANQQHWRLETLTKAACPLLQLPIDNPIRRAISQCEQWRAGVVARLQAERPRLIVVDMWRGYVAGEGGYDPGWTSYNAAWIDSLNRLVRQLRDTGAKVLVLGPVPDPLVSVPICVSGHLEDATACAPARSKAVNESGIAAELAATEAAGGRYVDLTTLFCTTERCPVIVGNTLVYFDWTHVTFEYSGLLAPVFRALATRELASS